MLLKQLNENKKAVKKTSTQFSDTPLQIQPVQITRSFSESSYLQTQAQPPLHESIIFDNESVVIKKQSRRVTTLEAKNALHLLIQSIQQEISEERTLNILPALNMKADPNNMWDVDRVKNYLSRNRSNKK